MEPFEYLKFKSSIYAKDLKNGEFLLLDKETGIWMKTSFSFKYLYKLLKKGVTKSEMKKKVLYFYSGREDEVNICIDSLRTNGFLEGFQANLLTPLNKIEPKYIICELSIDKNLLIDFLKLSFKDTPLELIFELPIHKDVNKININNLNLGLQNGEQIKPILRMDWEMVKREIIDELSDNDINNIQINFKDFGENKNDKSEKIKLIGKLIKEGKKVELRYGIAAFRRRAGEKDLILPLRFIPNSYYHFTVEEIFEFIKSKDRYKYFVYWVSTMSKFYQLYGIGAKSFIKFSSGNLLPMVVFSRVLRETCGAGVTNFYISKDGHLYPCKYLRDAPFGTIDKPIALPYLKYSEREKFVICEKCHFLRVCGRLCRALHQKEFSKICNFYKKYLIDYISAIPIKAFRDLYHAQEKYKEERMETSQSTKEEINRFTRRILCPIGIF